MIFAAAYCRVSTDKEDQANSYEAQLRFFRDYIGKNPDWKLYEIYADEGITGTSTKKRTQFNRMIHDAHEGKFQLLLTKEVSRFSRNIVDTLRYTRELKQLGIAVEFMTDNINTMDSDGELRLSIMATLAQEESRKTSNRVVWGQTRRMEEGIVFGRSMLGYDVKDGELVIEPQGAEIVKLIFQKYAQEQIGTSEIARFLTREGYRTYRGSCNWKPNGVIKILKNEKYAGDLIQKKTYTPDYLTHEKRSNKGQVPMIHIQNHHDPIVSREIWNLAQKKLEKNNKHRYSGHSNRYVFSGKIQCGKCGANFVGRIRTRKDGSKIRRWRCGTDRCGIGKLVRDDDARNMLKTAVRSLQFDSRPIVRSVAALAVEAVFAGENGIADVPEQLQLEIDQIQQKKETVMDHYFSGVITKEEMLAMKKRYETQMAAYRQRLKRAEDRKNQGRDMAAMRNAMEAEVDALLRFEKDSEILSKMLLDRLIVYPDRHMELTLRHLPMIYHFRNE